MAKEIGEEYLSSLADLNVNSKPLINMLTILAEENLEHASVIVQAVEQHLAKVNQDVKLPVLYLVDSIVKNVGREYKMLFSQCIVNMFCGVFEKVNEKVREKLFALRQTWTDVFPLTKLCALDIKVNCIDPGWPIMAKVTGPTKSPAIHVNPNFFKSKETAPQTNDMQVQLRDKQRELLELQKRKLELELLATKKIIEEQEREINMQTASVIAKQTTTTDTKPTTTNVISSSSQVQSVVNPLAVTTNIPAAAASVKTRIAPVNSALVSSVRMNDPRVQRQQQLLAKQNPSYPNVGQGNATGSNQQQNQNQMQNGPTKSNRIAPLQSMINNRSNDPRLIRQYRLQQQQHQIAKQILLNKNDNNNLQQQNNQSLGGTNQLATTTGVNNNYNINNNNNNNNNSNTNNLDVISDKIKSVGKINKFGRQQQQRQVEQTPATSLLSENLTKTKTLSTNNSSSNNNNNSSKSPNKTQSSSKGKSRSHSSSKLSSSPKTKDKNTSHHSSSSSSATATTLTTTNLPTDKKKQRKRSSSPIRHSEKSPKRSGDTRSKSSTTSPSSSSSQSITKFKELKTTTKGRNYIRRNRDSSRSPTPKKIISSPAAGKQDVDLRILNNQTPEKKQKLDNMTSSPPKCDTLTINNNEKTTTAATITPTDKLNLIEKNVIPEQLIEASAKDIDLRQLPTILSTPSTSSSTTLSVISSESSINCSPDNKKRGSTTINDKSDGGPISKRTKTEKIDELFGSEDVDLRTLNTSGLKPLITSIRPITPPPPVISTEKLDTTSWATLKGDIPKKQATSPIKSNFDAVRAKFAEATKNKTKSDDPERKKRTSILNKKTGDIDLRQSRDTLSDDATSQDGMDTNIKIMMSQVQEQLNNQDIDMEEYGNMMKQIFQINESKKIREAQKRERIKRRGPQQWQQNDLQPISDDEIGFSTGSDSDTKTPGERNLRKRGRFKNNKETRFSIIKSDEIKQMITSPPLTGIIDNIMDKSNQSVNMIESSFAASTAAELRKDPRWNKNENNNRWQSPWEQQQQLQQQQQQHNMPPGGWNMRPNLMMPNSSIPPPGVMPPFMPPGGNNRMQMLQPWNNSINQNQNQNNQNFNHRFNYPPNIYDRPPNILNVPPTIMNTTNIIPENTKDDIMRTINIDGIPREIRFYDDIAIAFMNWDEPKEIGFQAGQRRIVVDDLDTVLVSFNEPYKTFIIDGKSYQIRLGSPTRELYIDKKWYECFFGDPPIGILLDNKVRIFKLDGPAPQVKIGNLRQDLVVGKINLIVDAKTMVPIFLDSKIQYFEIDGQLNTLQFADYLLTVIINDETFTVEFGGLPKSLIVRGKKHFVRFTALPNNIEPGQIYIKNMIRTSLHRDIKTPPIPAVISLNDVITTPSQTNNTNSSNTTQSTNTSNTNTTVDIKSSDTLNTSNDDDRKFIPGFDFLTNLLPKSTGSTGYQIESSSSVKKEEDPNVDSKTSSTTTTTDNLVGNILGNANIDDLYQKLLASGILSKTTVTNATADSDDKKLKEKEKIKPILLAQPETLKIRQAAVVYQLFSGMQCSSCGVRFPPEQTMKYSQHLDWHFRQNRRDRDSVRRAHSRKWYYDVSDWIQYEEIEDLEEREKNWFETQQTEIETGQDDSNQQTDMQIPSCPAGQDDADKTCDMCHDPFEQFYNEEIEEWHLRPAIRVDNKTYHPLCYDDYKASLTLDESGFNISQDENDEKSIEDIKVKTEKNETDDDVKMEEDKDYDDDIIEITPQEPTITEILDDEDVETTTKEEEEDENTKQTDDKNESFGESDVEIQEPNIPITDLDDIEDLPTNVDESIDESSQFALIKIKEEPKDDEEEEDTFEDVVGSMVQTDSEMTTITDEHPITDSAGSNLSSQLFDSNSIEQSENSSVHSTQQTNKIRINITNTTNRPTSSSLQTIITSQQNENSRDTDGENNSETTNNSNNDKTEKIISNEQQEETKEEEILYELKSELNGIVFNKMETVKNGYETSGLCSIM